MMCKTKSEILKTINIYQELEFFFLRKPEPISMNITLEKFKIL